MRKGVKQRNIIRDTLVPGNVYMVENKQGNFVLMTYVGLDYHPSTYGYDSILMIADTIKFRNAAGNNKYLPLKTIIYDGNTTMQEINSDDVEPLFNFIEIEELMEYYVNKSTSTVTAFYNELKIGDSYSIMYDDDHTHEKNVLFKGFVNNEINAASILIEPSPPVDYPLYYIPVFSTRDNVNIPLNIFDPNVRVRVYHTIIKAKTHAALSMRKHGISNELFRHAESFIGGQSRKRRNSLGSRSSKRNNSRK